MGVSCGVPQKVDDVVVEVSLVTGGNEEDEMKLDNKKLGTGLRLQVVREVRNNSQ